MARNEISIEVKHRSIGENENLAYNENEEKWEMRKLYLQPFWKQWWLSVCRRWLCEKYLFNSDSEKKQRIYSKYYKCEERQKCQREEKCQYQMVEWAIWREAEMHSLLWEEEMSAIYINATYALVWWRLEGRDNVPLLSDSLCRSIGVAYKYRVWPRLREMKLREIQMAYILYLKRDLCDCMEAVSILCL